MRYLHNDHINRLPQESSGKLVKDIEVESQYVGKEEDATNIYAETANRLGFGDDVILVDITQYGADGHAFITIKQIDTYIDDRVH